MLTWVEIKDGVLLALSALRQNKFRAFLTILGVTVGVASVIGMASIVDGLNGAMVKEIDTLGSNVVWVLKFPPEVDHDDLTDEQRNRPPITVGEARAIFENCRLVNGVAPQNFYFARGGNVAKYMNRKYNQPRFGGTWPQFIEVSNKTMAEGRFISETDEQFRTMNCTIGSEVAKVLFEGEPAVGKEIRVNGHKLMVIGVFEEVKGNFGIDETNTCIYIPLSTFEKLHPWEEELLLQVKVVSYDKMEAAMDEITGVLRNYRKVPFGKADNFALASQDQLKDFIGNITKWIYIAMIIITSVGLMVGGIGVMNIMLVSVTERTREIGVRKAIGAKRINIILQFLTEAMTLSGTGGIIGIILGVSLGLIVNGLLDFPLNISVLWVILGFFVSVSVGLVSGMYPAIKAAWLDPIDALRYE